MILMVISTILLFTGIFFFAVGVTGLLRFPDVFTRLHATTKCDTLGAGLILLALALQSGFTSSAGKLLIIIAFIWLTNPTSAHAIAKAAISSGVPYAEGSFEIDHTDTPSQPRGKIKAASKGVLSKEEGIP